MSGGSNGGAAPVRPDAGNGSGRRPADRRDRSRGRVAIATAVVLAIGVLALLLFTLTPSLHSQDCSEVPKAPTPSPPPPTPAATPSPSPGPTPSPTPDPGDCTERPCGNGHWDAGKCACQCEPHEPCANWDDNQCVCSGCSQKEPCERRKQRNPSSCICECEPYYRQYCDGLNGTLDINCDCIHDDADRRLKCGTGAQRSDCEAAFGFPLLVNGKCLCLGDSGGSYAPDPSYCSQWEIWIDRYCYRVLYMLPI